MDELNLQPGERVRITIEADVRSVDGSYLRLKCPVGNATLIFRPNDYAATVERAAPAHWPPQAGDLWRREDFAQPDPADDGPDLDLWFAHYDHAIDRGNARLMLVPAHGDIEYAETRPEKLLAQGGRWALVRREGQPVPAPPSADPEKLARLLCRTSYEVRGLSEAAETWDKVSDAIRAEYRQEADALLRLCVVTPRQQDGGADRG